MNYVVYPVAAYGGSIDYEDEYQSQLEKWAYGQQFLNGTEQRDYYVSIGFYGSTYEDFLYYANNEADSAKNFHINSYMLAFGILAFVIGGGILLIFFPDEIKE